VRSGRVQVKALYAEATEGDGKTADHGIVALRRNINPYVPTPPPLHFPFHGLETWQGRRFLAFGHVLDTRTTENSYRLPMAIVSAAGHEDAPVYRLPMELRVAILGFLDPSDLCSVRSTSRIMGEAASAPFTALFHDISVPFTRTGLQALQRRCAASTICKHTLRVRFTLPTPILTQEMETFGFSYSPNTEVQHALENIREPEVAGMARAGSVQRLVFHLHESTSIHAMMWNGEAALILAAFFRQASKLQELRLYEGDALAVCPPVRNLPHGTSLPSSPAAAIFTAMAHAGVKPRSFFMVYHGQHAHPHGLSMHDLPLRTAQIGQKLRQLDISLTASVSGKYLRCV